MTEHQETLRILAISSLWQGANDYAFVRAFRRMGHSVRAVSEKEFLSGWQSSAMRLARRLLQSRMIDEFNEAVLREASAFRPDMLFAFKGPFLKAQTLRQLKSMGVITIQFYPDVSFRTHGPFLAEALTEYDWVFTTKNFGLMDMAEQLGITQSSFLPHAFDPETHCPIPLSKRDRAQYGCDASFIGNWSPKKEKVLRQVIALQPDIDLRVWGARRWAALGEAYQGHPVYGQEYAKAIRASSANIALLSEQREGASSGDQITARTFEIPGAGGFMLHERTEEAEQYFQDGKNCVFFDDAQDLADKISHYLAHDADRARIAAAGRARSLDSGYSTDDRAHVVIDKYYALRASIPKQKAAS